MACMACVACVPLCSLCWGQCGCRHHRRLPQHCCGGRKHARPAQHTEQLKLLIITNAAALPQACHLPCDARIRMLGEAGGHETGGKSAPSASCDCTLFS